MYAYTSETIWRGRVVRLMVVVRPCVGWCVLTLVLSCYACLSCLLGVFEVDAHRRQTSGMLAVEGSS